MRILCHYIYEYRKGVRNLILCTLPAKLEEEAKNRLERYGISYIVQKLPNGNMNIFFGDKECLDVTCQMCRGRMLNQLSPEEDFMLGILLGYSVKEQCIRYSKKQKTKNHIQLN